ncbi:MAG: SGNH/GDSL hydrolase family protein [Nannocystaceae bacterium]|nr:SGNH/GDSL hydrolase family protein [Nannocystaceae bacterium]
MPSAPRLPARVRALGLAAAAACGGPPPGPPPSYAPVLAPGESVFFVGNSFFDWEQRRLPQWVASIGEAATPRFAMQTGDDIVPGDLPLIDFLDDDAVREALASRRHAVFVLQGHEYEAVDAKAQFHQAVRDFHAAITAAGGRTVLFMTWELRWREFIDELSASYDEIGRELGIPVIPAGLVFADCGQSPPPGRSRHWLTASATEPEGDLHPNAAGMAASAYTSFAILTGRDPTDVPLPAAAAELDAATLQQLSRAAWRRAQPRLQPAPAEVPRP